MIHLVAAVSAASILLCTLLPFLPGAYDPLAAPLSLMAQAGGIVSLLLVPAGAAWWASRRSAQLPQRAWTFAAIVLVVAALVWLLVSLFALIASRALGVVTGATGLYVAVRIARRWRRQPEAASADSAVAPYLVVLPVAVVALQWVVVPPAVEFSRSRAIRHSERMIADIEQYRVTNGRYPLSLQALWPDYQPGVIGIERFHYEPSGESYNVFFENPALSFGTREIVMYNPRDEQEFTSHPMDLLQYPPEQVNRMRGYYAVHAAAHPHWKYFWFD